MKHALHFVALGLMAVLSTAVSLAHEIRPGYLEIREESADHLAITWKQPVVGDVALPLHPSLSAGWLDPDRAAATYTDTYLIRRWTVEAAPTALEGQQLVIEGLRATLTDVLVRIAPANGDEVVHLIKPDQPAWRIPALSKAAPAVPHYFALGIEHIWTGIDHLLFVLGLMLLATGFRALVATITAFTVAHSITLAAATLGLIEASPAPIEAVIALSIMFLAAELIRLRRGEPGFPARHAWILAFAFGLLHGFGFAGALGDVGLPADRIPAALLLFNIGIEVGQIAFVCAMLLVLQACTWLAPRAAIRLEQAMPHVIGSLAGFWFIERSLAVLS